MLAENLRNVIDGKYYIKGRKFFVIDPKIIPVSGVYIGYDKKIPDKQILPKNSFRIVSNTDRVNVNREYLSQILDSSQAYLDFSIYDNFMTINTSDSDTLNITISSSEDLIKKFFHNPIGILPYFPPSTSSGFDDDMLSEESGTEESGTEESGTEESGTTESSTPDPVPETPSNDEGGLEE